MQSPADYDTLLAELVETASAYPHLAEAIDLECALLEAGSRLEVSIPPVSLTRDIAQGRLESGLPLLPQEEVLVSGGQQLSDFRRTVGSLVAAHRPELSDELDRLSRATTPPCSGQSMAGQESHSELGSYIQHQTLRPFLVAHACALAAMLSDMNFTGWQCPICGSGPDMAALTRPDGQRILLCSACDTRWPCQRIGCPFCGNEDPSTWAYYPSDDGVYRLYVCDACGGYLKTVDQREQVRPRLLATERILTIGMDAAAVDAGYQILPGD
ncbi:MAG: formate dehydrogenase accessory protein FdhE [Chloroflexota bacterium]|nr:formate dehydrogenase accessory protein FdhE [Chloroflexota bacterium]